MFGQNLFIADIEKCNTTSLAHWFVNNSLVECREPSMKEPYSNVVGDVSVNRGRTRLIHRRYGEGRGVIKQ